MDANLDVKKNALIYMALVFALAMVISLVIGLYWYSQQVDSDSIKNTPNTFFCPLGTPMEESTIIELKNSQEAYHQVYDLSNIIDAVSPNWPVIDLANKMFELLKDTQRANQAREISQIDIPQNACYIGTIDNPVSISNQEILTELEFDLLHINIELYAWNHYHNLNSGKKVQEVHLVMIYNDTVVYGKIKTSGNSKAQMDIIYGNRK